MIIKSYEVKRNNKNFLTCNLNLLYGENIGLKKDIREFIKNTIKQKNNNLELISLYEDEILANDENFYNLIYSGSLFGDSKIITIYEATDKIVKKLSDIYEKHPQNIFLIIFSEILEKKSKLRNFFEKNKDTICIPCYLDSDKDLEIILQNELRKDKIALSKEVINLVVQKSNSDRNNLKNEIEKIKSFSLNKKNLDIGDIKLLINFSGDYKSDILINECLCGNILQYKKIITEFYTNTLNQIMLLRILSNKIQRLLKLKEQENSKNNIDSIINSSRPPIFWKEKPQIKKQLSIWSLEELNRIINKINSAELLCKKNPQIAKIVFFNLFSNICKKANKYS